MNNVVREAEGAAIRGRWAPYLLGISIFCFSTASFSSSMGLIAYSLLGCLVIQGIANGIEVKFNCKVLLSVIFIYVYGMTLTLYLGNFSQYGVYLQALVLYCLIILTLLYSGGITKDIMDKAVRIFLIISVASVLVQFLVYLWLGHYIGFNEMIRQDSSHSAYLSPDLKGFAIPIRVTGFFSEPSFYAMSILPGLLYVALSGGGRGVVFYSAVASVYLSLSVAAFLVMTVFLSLLFFIGEQSHRQKLGIVVLLAILVSIAGGFAYKRAFNSDTYDTIGFRIKILNEFSVRSGLSNLVGVGYFLDEFGATNGVTGLSAAGVRDSGFYASTFYSGGLIGILILVGVLVSLAKSVKDFLLISCILLMKYSILSSMLWLALVFVLVNNYFTRRLF